MYLKTIFGGKLNKQHLNINFNLDKMKRDAYGDDGPMQKRQRQTDDEVTFLIPSKVRFLL